MSYTKKLIFLKGNNAGEWLSYSPDTGDIMVYTDSDTVGGFGFLKLTPN